MMDGWVLASEKKIASRRTFLPSEKAHVPIMMGNTNSTPRTRTSPSCCCCGGVVVWCGVRRVCDGRAFFLQARTDPPPAPRQRTLSTNVSGSPAWVVMEGACGRRSRREGNGRALKGRLSPALYWGKKRTDKRPLARLGRCVRRTSFFFPSQLPSDGTTGHGS